MLELFVSAFLLGMIFNAAPGAILIESMRHGFKGGFIPALAVQIGSLVGDALWVILGLGGAAVILTIPLLHTPLAIAGAILLGYLAFTSFKDARQPMPDLTHTLALRESKGALATGVSLSISNPLNITYWAALGGTIATIAGTHPTAQHFLVFILGFMLSCLLWCFFAAAMIALSRQFLNPTLWKTLHFGCGICLVILMGYVIWGIIA